MHSKGVSSRSFRRQAADPDLAAYVGSAAFFLTPRDPVTTSSMHTESAALNCCNIPISLIDPAEGVLSVMAW
jgi:hypothetical protein